MGTSNGSEELDAPAQRLSPQVLPRMQAAYWKLQAATARLEVTQQSLAVARQEYDALLREVNESHHVAIGTIHDWVVETGEIFPIGSPPPQSTAQ